MPGQINVSRESVENIPISKQTKSSLETTFQNILRLRQLLLLYESSKVQDAGLAYKRCGSIEERLKKPEIAASFYHEAALCFQKDDPQGGLDSSLEYRAASSENDVIPVHLPF